MKNKLIAVLTVASLLAVGQSGFAQTGGTAFDKDYAAVMSKIRAKMSEGGKPKKLTAADLTDEIKTIDDLIAKNKTSNPENALRATQLKSSVYAQVLGDREAAKKIGEQMNADYGDLLKKQKEEMAARQAAAKKIQDDLAVGKKFPDFSEQDTSGKPLSIANFKGKVVLIDFWATWCGPCVKELPHVQATYDKHHKNGFEIIGISLDSDKSKLDKFVAEKNMKWPQFFDGQGWKNKLSTQYGVNSIPATYLLDGDGVIIAKNLRGDALEQAVAKALKKS